MTRTLEVKYDQEEERNQSSIAAIKGGKSSKGVRRAVAALESGSGQRTAKIQKFRWQVNAANEIIEEKERKMTRAQRQDRANARDREYAIIEGRERATQAQYSSNTNRRKKQKVKTYSHAKRARTPLYTALEEQAYGIYVEEAGHAGQHDYEPAHWMFSGDNKLPPSRRLGLVRPPDEAFAKAYAYITRYSLERKRNGANGKNLYFWSGKAEIDLRDWCNGNIFTKDFKPQAREWLIRCPYLVQLFQGFVSAEEYSDYIHGLYSSVPLTSECRAAVHLHTRIWNGFNAGVNPLVGAVYNDLVRLKFEDFCACMITGMSFSKWKSESEQHDGLIHRLIDQCFDEFYHDGQTVETRLVLSFYTAAFPEIRQLPNARTRIDFSKPNVINYGLHQHTLFGVAIGADDTPSRPKSFKHVISIYPSLFLHGELLGRKILIAARRGYGCFVPVKKPIGTPSFTQLKLEIMNLECPTLTINTTYRNDEWDSDETSDSNSIDASPESGTIPSEKRQTYVEIFDDKGKGEEQYLSCNTDSSEDLCHVLPPVPAPYAGPPAPQLQYLPPSPVQFAMSESTSDEIAQQPLNVTKIKLRKHKPLKIQDTRRPVLEFRQVNTIAPERFQSMCDDKSIVMMLDDIDEKSIPKEIKQCLIRMQHKREYNWYIIRLAQPEFRGLESQVFYEAQGYMLVMRTGYHFESAAAWCMHDWNHLAAIEHQLRAGTYGD
jgi:hypothetical protein